MKNHTSDHYRRALQHFIQSMIVAAFTPALIFGITIGTSCAGSGTWILNPINDDWNTAANWSSDTVPGPLDEATFGVFESNGYLGIGPSLRRWHYVQCRCRCLPDHSSAKSVTRD